MDETPNLHAFDSVSRSAKHALSCDIQHEKDEPWDDFKNRAHLYNFFLQRVFGLNVFVRWTNKSGNRVCAPLGVHSLSQDCQVPFFFLKTKVPFRVFFRSASPITKKRKICGFTNFGPCGWP